MNKLIDNCFYTNLKKIKNNGILTIAESERHIPFSIKRVYYISDLNQESMARGFHAHKELEQVIFCISGSFHLHLDNGIDKQDIILKQNEFGIYMKKMIWHTMSGFSDHCMILVFASDYYYESDYIREYDVFQRELLK